MIEKYAFWFLYISLNIIFKSKKSKKKWVLDKIVTLRTYFIKSKFKNVGIHIDFHQNRLINKCARIIIAKILERQP